MNRMPKLLLLAGLISAPAFAEEVVVYRYATPSLVEIYSEPVAPDRTLVTERVVYEPVVYAPAVVEERVIVTAPPLSEDQAITRDVVDTLVTNPRLSGRIGVETRNNTVSLTGRVATPGQVRAAERDAKSVPGVREVQSELRPSVGGSY